MSTESPNPTTPSPKTPSRQNSCFSPIQLKSSPAEHANHRNLTGHPRVIRDIAADLYNAIQKWNGQLIAGAAIVKQIALLKSEATEQLPAGLEPLTKQLYNVMRCIRTHCDALTVAKKQITALVKLQKQGEPIFVVLTIEGFAKRMTDVVEAYEKELQVKECILENIAFARGKDEVLVYAAAWAHQVHVTDNINMKVEQVLIECGHRTIC